ncbi:MAG: tetratricopeptide repeat protein, partial [Elusimicrobia bacterium]|nr:tetratricopeptide repeat protein [Elusimicrobiota bacterium]
MTRTSRATAVFALFFCLAAPVRAGNGSTPSPKPAAGDPKLDTTFKLLVYPGDDPKTTGMSDARQQKVKKAFQAYNDALTDAQAQAQQTAKTASARQDAVRKDSRLADALTQVGDVLNDPGVSSNVREQGAAAFNAGGRPKDAAALSEQTLKAEPDNRDALNNLSQARFSLGQYQDAIANATRLMKLDPDNESAYTTRALSNYYSGHYLEAREDAQRALALNKENEVAFATLRMADSRVKQAELKLGPGATEQANRIRAEYQAMLEQQNQQEAETARTQGSRAPARIQTPAPESADAASSPGQAALQRAAASNQAGEYEQAVADATEALRLSPGSALALDARSRALLNLGRVEDAARDATDAIRLDPANAYPFATRARAREKMKDWAGMLADFQQASRLNPQFEPDYRRALERHALPPAPRAATPVPARGDESGA